MKLAMSTKIKYMIPAFAAVFALVFVFTPYVMAENGVSAMWGDGAKHPRGHMGPHVIQVEGFTGTIQIPVEMTRETHDSLKSQVKVSLSQAVSIAEASGVTDAMMANIGIVEDDTNNKYLVWIIISMDKDVESETMTANIFVVDAGDATNFITVTKAFDHSKMSEGMYGDKMEKFEKFQQKFSEPTGNADVDAARAHFLDLMQQLRDAIKNGDTATAESIKKQLEEIRPSFLNMRNSGF
jgi:hypothetical protein